MISPDRYADLLSAGRIIMMANPTEGVMGMPDADRLEAAVDEAMLLHARDGGGFDGDGDLCFSIWLRDLRSWLGTGGNYCGWSKWDWRKDRIVRLFLEGVAGRYVAGGWTGCDAGYGEPQSQHIWFELKSRRSVDDPRGRSARAMDDLGEILGVEQSAPPPDSERLADYLESLRMRAAMMRFDLEATRREAGAAPDGYSPPFEGSPDDGSFGGG